MGTVRRGLRAVFSGFRAVLTVIAAAAVFWAICYRLILGFTPAWLDAVTLIAAALGMLVLVGLGRSGGNRQNPPNDVRSE